MRPRLRTFENLTKNCVSGEGKFKFIEDIQKLKQCAVDGQVDLDKDFDKIQRDIICEITKCSDQTETSSPRSRFMSA